MSPFGPRAHRVVWVGETERTIASGVPNDARNHDLLISWVAQHGSQVMVQRFADLDYERLCFSSA